MTELMEFKKELKQGQVKDRAVLKDLLKEVDDARRRITKLTLLHPDDFARMFPMLNKELKYYTEIEGMIEKGVKYIPINWEHFLNDVVKRGQALYNENQVIINAMENDKIINYIDLERLFIHLTNSELSYEYTLKILGMVVAFNQKYLQTHASDNLKNVEMVQELSVYFDECGNPVFIKDINLFGQSLLKLISRYFWSCLDFIKKGLYKSDEYMAAKENFDNLVSAYTDLLKANNERLKVAEKGFEKSNKDTAFEIVKSTFTESQAELKKYYKSGVLIAIPSDIEEFTKLLNDCGMDETEKRYVLGLVQSEFEKIQQNSVLKHLSEEDRDTYKRASDLLNDLKKSDEDYYILIQLFADLQDMGDILSSCDDVEKIEYVNELAIIMTELDNILSKYTLSSESENNFVFLCNSNGVPYLKEDSDKIDGSFYKAVCNGIRKIRKDNQGNFKLVMTSDNMPYRLYDILSSKIHISFIEIDNGIYLIVGANIVSQGYDELVRRVISYEHSIKELELLVKDARTRNQVLSNHEEYLELFNPENPNFGRKRVNLDSKN